MAQPTYWICDVQALTAQKMILSPGTVLAPPATENGVLPLAEAGLEIVLARLAEIFTALEGETQAQANERARQSIAVLSTVDDAMTAFGFEVLE